MMMHIEGRWDDRVVLVDGAPLSPARSQEVWNHSPDGFMWGYGGSGPAQLALAILLAAGCAPRRAVAFHQSFKWAVIGPLPQADFAIDVDVEAWIQTQR
jgi:hypothetical protein